jgi:hypothetical protein
MAHFAELNSDNVVLRIVVVDNNDVNSHGGDLSEQVAEYVKTIIPLIGGTRYVQTSYNSKFRKSYAVIGGKYLPEKDIFIGAQIYQSWILNSNDVYQPPVSRPSEDQRYRDLNKTSIEINGEITNIPQGLPCPISWEESIVGWVCIDSNNVVRKWNTNNNTWEVI